MADHYNLTLESTSPFPSGVTEKEVVHAGLQKTMTRAAKEIIQAAEIHKLGLDVRTAAYIVAIEKIFRSYKKSGFM